MERKILNDIKEIEKNLIEAGPMMSKVEFYTQLSLLRFMTRKALIGNDSEPFNVKIIIKKD